MMTRTMTPTLIAYHGKPEVKELYLSRVQAHVAADELIKGRYWENGKGCAVGCTIHGADHSRYETELGIPCLLAKLEDEIFEALPNGEAKAWPERFLAAIQPGADLAQVWPQFAVWLLVDKDYGVIQFARTDRSRDAIQAVADAYAKVVEDPRVEVEIDWRKLRDAAACAVAAASADAVAYASAYAAVAYAAYSADAAYAAVAYAAIACAAADAVAYAAYSADAAYAAVAYAAYSADAAAAAVAAASADAVDAAVARSKCRIAQSEKLLELLASAPIATLEAA